MLLRKKRMFRLLGGIILGGLLGGCGILEDLFGGDEGPQPPNTGNVQGYIYTDINRAGQLLASRSPASLENLRPVEGAQVAITGSPQIATTNAQGYYRLEKVPAGTQTLTVQKPGFNVLQLKVTVIAGQTVSAGESLGGRKWTLLIFLNADNDLEPYGVEDVNEMEKIGSTDEVAIVVIMDRSPGFDSSNGDWTDTRRFVIEKDDDPRTMTSARLPADGGKAEALGELDLGDPRTLKEFIKWGQERYPAEHYLLDLWNHGSGWRHRRVWEAAPTRGVSFDDTQGTHITTTELPYALDVENRLDLVVFDSSLMQMFEVAYEIHHRTDIIVGSEESPPGEGYPYDEWLAPLTANPDMTPQELAQTIVNKTIDFLSGTFDVTQSALIAAQLPLLATALDRFAAALIAAYDKYGSGPFDRARRSTQRYGFGSIYFAPYKDLIDYGDQVVAETNDDTLRERVNALKQALGQALLAERHAGSSVSRSHGLSIYVPDSTDYRDTRTRYRKLALAKETRWDEWLDTYTGEGK